MSKIWKIAFALLALTALAVSCDDKGNDSDYTYISGTLSLVIPDYVDQGYTKTFRMDTLMKAYRADEGTVGYCFRDASDGTYDTLVTAQGVVLEEYYTLSVPSDTLGTLSLRLTAFAPAEDHFYSISAEKSFTVVNPSFLGDGTITNFAVASGEPTMTDPRDGRAYFYSAQTPATDWMRQNLAWDGAGVSYEESPAMDPIFGRYYTWEEAQTACPEGWRLPSDADWAALGAVYGNSSQTGEHLTGLAGDMMEDLYFNGTKMWEYWREVKVTNEARTSVMPTGYAIATDGDPEFRGTYNYAAFWTSDEVDAETGVYRYIYQDKDIVYYGEAPKTDFLATVRCVRDR